LVVDDHHVGLHKYHIDADRVGLFWFLSLKDDRLKRQIRLDNIELSRLLDAYRCCALELPELQKRRQLVNSKLEMLSCEQELLRKMAAEKKKVTDVKASLGEFAALVWSSLKRISFENKQKVLRMVVDKVVVNDCWVHVHHNIPLPKIPKVLSGGSSER